MNKKLVALLALVLMLTSLLSACISSQTQAPAPHVVALKPTLTPDNWWNDAVFYEIFVRSFYDSNGDGIGDFNGLTEKLDYLNDGNPATTDDLGITGLWLMPIQVSPSYHGYDITDYYAINPDYGTMDDFRRFLNGAHARGIRVVIDLVMNHTAEDHPWFEQSKDPTSPYRDWYIWSDEDPGYLGPWGEDVWHFSAGAGYYYGIFWSGMPDLNYNNPAVTTEMRNVATYWLLDVGVDGFRVDAARHLIEDGQTQSNTDATHAWFKDFYALVKTENPEAMTVAEVWDTLFAAVPYVKNDEFDLVFGFELASAYMGGINGADARQIVDALSFNYNTFPPGEIAPFLTNHDMNRVMSEFAGDEDKARVAAVLLLTSPGVPFIYYGEEIGMIGTKPDEEIRTPMQWSAETGAGFTSGSAWINPKKDYVDKNVAAQLSDSNSLLSHYRNMIAIRGQHEALRTGQYVKVTTNDNRVLAAIYATENETILVLINLSSEKVNQVELTSTAEFTPDIYRPATLLGDGRLADIKISADGEFSGYRPANSLEPYATYIVVLTQK
jgi:glycosidase